MSADPFSFFPSGSVIERIAWQRLDTPGHDTASIVRACDSRHVAGVASFVHESQLAILAYSIRCDSAWRTQSAVVSGRIGQNNVDLTFSADLQRRWMLNGRPCPAVDGCTDLDLNFTPATNTLSLRRLSPEIGQTMEVNTAWLEFPSFVLQPLRQVYRRDSDATYDYTTPSLDFHSTLRVTPNGFVTHYPPLWEPAAR